MTLQIPSSSVESSLDDFQKEIESDYDLTTRSINEVKLMLEQSQNEMTKLTQRNATITAHLQQVQAQFDTMPRPDIRTAYNAALDAQQRLFVMRGQLEKLQNDVEALQRYLNLLEKIRGAIAQGLPEKKKPSERDGMGGSSTLEMVVKAQESERQRLSRQMHDGPAQALSNFIVQTEIANRLLDIDVKRAKEELDNLKGAAMHTFKDVRTFIFELRPMMLDDLGLVPTIRRYIDTLREQTSCDITFTPKSSERRLESYLEVMIFRAVQELIGNSIRHNKDYSGKLQVTIQMIMDDSITKVIVADNGKGFNPAVIEQKGGVGIKVIRERVELLGGNLDVDSDPGKGSRITFQVPTLDAKPPEE